MKLAERLLKGLNNSSEKILKDSSRLNKLYKLALKKFDKLGLSEFTLQNLKTMISMAQDFINGNYRAYNRKNIILIISGLLYLVNPFDLIPDFLIGIGFLDDIYVMKFIIKKITKEIDRYNAWKNIK
ncbi:uncharacterized membrane protein YkvA (DUF1232 family) [Peptoniphilus koenoeneniae]|uniref:Uncharacterized membrane protein YkvA (DUF1232 family) n=1 Tax=Peptoniphilus koenoeneniae TaxID=507751 RepID=A0ABU0AT55_9FIRM|nr:MULTISPECIES: DUF1232 domain-containing protein [Peptoniphilus]ERT56880.1 PF06803 family protein [Peptoniphilus sp. BV3C26]MDQ0274200.1 uncharacterized membrane protein YkvA (DUF1232 family) [Peptoniphilus koenoeneniae]